jgi:glutamate decarboxylase
LNFSRPGGQIIAQYYNFIRLGRAGYAKIQNACYETARYFAREITRLGPFEILYGGETGEGIPCVSWKIRDGVKTPFSLYDLADRLRVRGWQVPAYSMPANRQDLVVQRILVRHGVSRDLVSLLLEDFQRCLAFFEKHPVAKSISAEEGSGYHH